jgi:hypothetical protein
VDSTTALAPPWANHCKSFEYQQRRGTAAIHARVLSGGVWCCRSLVANHAAWYGTTAPIESTGLALPSDHVRAVEELLAFAEHVLTNAVRLSMELGIDQKQQLQQVLFPKGVCFDGERFGTAVTCLAFRQLAENAEAESSLACPRGKPTCMRNCGAAFLWRPDGGASRYRALLRASPSDDAPTSGTSLVGKPTGLCLRSVERSCRHNARTACQPS